MKVSEMIKLASAGFKASDIKAMIEQEAEELKIPEEPKKDPEPEKKVDVKPEPKEDFEALYMKTLEELGETKKKLEAAQADNRNAGRANGLPTIDDEFKKAQELFRR